MHAHNRPICLIEEGWAAEAHGSFSQLYVLCAMYFATFHDDLDQIFVRQGT